MKDCLVFTVDYVSKFENNHMRIKGLWEEDLFVLFKVSSVFRRMPLQLRCLKNIY
jgi:hypothetical protein